jgi:drug/metabolite transporter (DMT)-like permease
MNSMLRYHLYALFAVTVWGATFVSTKVLIGFGLSPAEIFLIRFLMAYICLLPFAKGKLWADSWQGELRFAGVSITGGSLFFLAENMALEYAPASNVSLIVCSAPVWTALLLALLYRNERMNARQIWGSVVAFLGMVLVVLNGRFVLQIAPKGDLLAFAAAWLWVLYSLIIKQIGHRYKALFITRKTFFYGLLTILPWFLYEPFEVDWTTLLHPLVAGNLLFLGVVASMLCYLVWAVAMRELGAVRATNYIYLNPLITILTAAICIAERITPIALLGAGLILYGMWRAERN